MDEVNPSPLQLLLGIGVLATVCALFLRQYQQVRRFCSCRRLEKAPDVIPPYWQNAGKSLAEALDRSSPEYFDDIYPVPVRNREILQGFLNETSSNTEVHFNLVRAVRVEHSRLWFHYQEKAADVAVKRGPLKFQGLGAPSTNHALANVESDGWDGGFVHALDEEVCEAYLFHGTDPHSALKVALCQNQVSEVDPGKVCIRLAHSSGHSACKIHLQCMWEFGPCQIVENGFQVKASRAGKRYGFGGYFSEDPAVADRYWVAVKELNLNYYIGETRSVTIYTHCGNLDPKP